MLAVPSTMMSVGANLFKTVLELHTQSAKLVKARGRPAGALAVLAHDHKHGDHDHQGCGEHGHDEHLHHPRHHEHHDDECCEHGHAGTPADSVSHTPSHSFTTSADGHTLVV